MVSGHAQGSQALQPIIWGDGGWMGDFLPNFL